jgi:hypothetical protein
MQCNTDNEYSNPHDLFYRLLIHRVIGITEKNGCNVVNDFDCSSITVSNNGKASKIPYSTINELAEKDDYQGIDELVKHTCRSIIPISDNTEG